MEMIIIDGDAMFAQKCGFKDCKYFYKDVCSSVQTTPCNSCKRNPDGFLTDVDNYTKIKRKFIVIKESN
jgi:hypothetical protein